MKLKFYGGVIEKPTSDVYQDNYSMKATPMNSDIKIEITPTNKPT